MHVEGTRSDCQLLVKAFGFIDLQEMCESSTPPSRRSRPRDRCERPRVLGSSQRMTFRGDRSGGWAGICGRSRRLPLLPGKRIGGRGVGIALIGVKERPGVAAVIALQHLPGNVAAPGRRAGQGQADGVAVRPVARPLRVPASCGAQTLRRAGNGPPWPTQSPASASSARTGNRRRLRPRLGRLRLGLCMIGLLFFLSSVEKRNRRPAPTSKAGERGFSSITLQLPRTCGGRCPQR